MHTVNATVYDKSYVFSHQVNLLALPFHVLRVPGFGDCCSNWASCHSVISAIPGAGLVQHRPSDNIKKDVLESEWNEFQGTIVGDQGHGSMGKWGCDSDGYMKEVGLVLKGQQVNAPREQTCFHSL